MVPYFTLILVVVCCICAKGAIVVRIHQYSNSEAEYFNLTLSGPILLEDYHLVEKLANFDRERIPERVVHARGASAKGFFEATHDISHLTCADFLRAPGVQTPVIVRFSTVIHERGSPETLRDPRGFAVKFYTREVWDLVPSFHFCIAFWSLLFEKTCFAIFVVIIYLSILYPNKLPLLLVQLIPIH